MKRTRGTAKHDDSWSVILAGGEGERIRPLVEDWLGYHKPKQYCAFVGCRSLFQHTVDRADRMASPKQRVAVVAETHRSEVAVQLRGRSLGTVVHQPRNRGTAAGVFLGLTYVRARDKNALVTIFPSDHFVHPEARFAEAVAEARRIARRRKDALVLLGVRPEGPETEYGWIDSAGLDRESAGAFRAPEVRGFVEKPSPGEAGAALARGALWNALIVTGRLATFSEIGFKLLPEMMALFEELEETIGEEHRSIVSSKRKARLQNRSEDVVVEKSDGHVVRLHASELGCAIPPQELCRMAAVHVGEGSRIEIDERAEEGDVQAFVSQPGTHLLVEPLVPSNQGVRRTIEPRGASHSTSRSVSALRRLIRIEEVKPCPDTSPTMR